MTTTGTTAPTPTAPPVLLTGGTGTTGRRVARRLRDRGVPVTVPRLVLLSGRGEPGAQRAEDGVREVAEATGAGWTVVRAAWFGQDFAESFLLEEVRSGVVRLPVDDVREPFVDVDDVADVVTAALLDDGHHGRVHEVTGPRALTFGEALAHVAGAVGRPVRLETTTREDHLAGLRATGADETTVWLLDHLFTDVLDGRNTSPTDGVQRALGRPPRDLTAHLPAAVAAGTWATPS